MLTTSLISSLIAAELPGEGSIYLEQELAFRRPVVIGDTPEARVEVLAISKPGLYQLTTVMLKHTGEVAIDGDALVLRR